MITLKQQRKHWKLKPRPKQLARRRQKYRPQPHQLPWQQQQQALHRVVLTMLQQYMQILRAGQDSLTPAAALGRSLTPWLAAGML
jgi:hypothetical protein